MANVLCEPCNERGNRKTSVLWYVNCKESLCTDCTENHRDMKMSRSHHLIVISKIKKKKERDPNDRPILFET